MARLLISICSRCGADFEETPHGGAGGWFRNRYDEWCHMCPDGTVGGLTRADATAERPSVEPSGPGNLPLCPICGGSLAAGVVGELLANAPGEPVDRWIEQAGGLDASCGVCMDCLIAVIDPPNGRVDLLPLDGVLALSPTACLACPWDSSATSAEVEHAAALYHRARNLSGLALPVDLIPSILSLYRQDVPHASFRCATCNRDEKMRLYSRSEGKVAYYARGVRLVGAESYVVVRCADCGREDHYIHEAHTDLMIWAASPAWSPLNGAPSLPAACVLRSPANIKPEHRQALRPESPDAGATDPETVKAVEDQLKAALAAMKGD